MGAQGTTTINFGAAPGSYEASVTVAAPGVGAATLVEAWVFPTATADHSADEHLIDPPRVVAGAVSAGVGFTIYGYAPGNWPAPLLSDGRFDADDMAQQPSVYGLWTVAWVWN